MKTPSEEMIILTSTQLSPKFKITFKVSAAESSGNASSKSYEIETALPE